METSDPVQNHPKEKKMANLLHLYEIRVAEMHHYNTLVWAFPLAYLGLILLEIEHLGEHKFGLLIAAIFNFILCAYFITHIANKNTVRNALIAIESEIKDEKFFDHNCFPEFQYTNEEGPGHATNVIRTSICAATTVVFFYSIFRFIA